MDDFRKNSRLHFAEHTLTNIFYLETFDVSACDQLETVKVENSNFYENYHFSRLTKSTDLTEVPLERYDLPLTRLDRHNLSGVITIFVKRFLDTCYFESVWLRRPSDLTTSPDRGCLGGVGKAVTHPLWG